MRSVFHSRPSEALPAEPVAVVFPEIHGAQIAAMTVGERVAGDFYDSFRVSPERILFGLLDVAGRREENLNILTSAQQIFRELGSELFSRSDLNESDAMTELCLRINHRIIEVSKGVHSCPAFIGCYHEQFGTLCYTNAGHTPALLRDHTGIAELGSTGLPLGLFSHSTCEAPTVGMEKSASLLLVSRGVVEAGRNHDKSAEFGLDGVKQSLQSQSAESARDLCAAVLNEAGKFAAAVSHLEDRTALALVRMA